MIKEGKFGVQEAICFVTITSAAKAFYTSPAKVMEIVGTASWYMTIISVLTAAVAFTFVFRLLKAFPGKNLMEIYDITLGKIVGFVFSMILTLWFIFMVLSNLREFTDVILVYALPTTPPSFVAGLALIGAVIMSYLGFESLVRFSKLFAYILLAGVILVLVLAAENYSFHHLFPILGFGIWPTVSHGVMRSSAYGEIIIVAVIAKSLQGIEHVKKVGYGSLWLSGVLVAAMLLSFTLTFPYTAGQELTAPMYVMASLIDYGRFFQRLESVFLFTWYISSFIAIAGLFYTAIYIYCHIFKISDKRPIIMPFAVILFTLALIPESILVTVEKIVPINRGYGWMALFVPPVIAYIAAILTKKKEGYHA